MTVISGVDPGERGAIAFLDVVAHTLAVYDMPISELTRTTTKKEVDGYAVSHIIKLHTPMHSFVEDVSASPQMGVTSSFAFGDRYGSIRTSFETLGVSVHRVKPQVWKSKTQTSKDKKQAVHRACQLFPQLAHIFRVVRHAGVTGTSHFDGRAEASILALYGAFSLGFTLTKPVSEWK